MPSILRTPMSPDELIFNLLMKEKHANHQWFSLPVDIKGSDFFKDAIEKLKKDHEKPLNK